MPPHQNAKIASKLLISLKADFRKWRELSNSGGPSADEPYEIEVEHLPKTLTDALISLRADESLTNELGKDFVDYYCFIKEAEIARFNLEVTEWEQREYFEMF